MPGGYQNSPAMAFTSDEDIPPPVVDRIIEKLELFYSAACSMNLSSYGASVAPGDHGKESFMYGALANDEILPDDVKSVLREKITLLRRKTHRRIGQRDLLLTDERIRGLVGGYCEQPPSCDESDPW